MDLPNHIAIIMDGNRRWAKKRFLPNLSGHKKGAENVDLILRKCNDLGIKHLTVYAFSTENWKRENKEINYLMNLLSSYIEKFIKESENKKVKLNFLGDLNKLSDKLVKEINYVKELTKNNQGIHFNIAINYGGRDEILRAVKKMFLDYKNKNFELHNLNEDTFKNYLDTKNIPDPDLLIRTSGEIRISNFLLWQLAYTELYFTNKFWPDFNEKDLIDAIKNYGNRNIKRGI